MNRVTELTEGKALIVSDLHGDWDGYRRYRDSYLALRDRGDAQYFVLLGDLVHAYGDAAEDQSLEIVLDLIALQERLPGEVIALMGNHEMPHIYGFTLVREGVIVTQHFEHAMGSQREAVLRFFDAMPFFAVGRGGLALTHAGPHPRTANPDVLRRLLTYSHQALLAEADELLAVAPLPDLVDRLLNLSWGAYLRKSQAEFAVTGEGDARAGTLLRGMLAAQMEAFERLWDLLFTQCEAETRRGYAELAMDFVEGLRESGLPVEVLVTGHIVTPQGYSVITDRHLRIASAAHARPYESGRCLWIDVREPVRHAEDLLPHLYGMP